MHKLQVGDQVVYKERYDSEPVVTRVVHVTGKARWVSISGSAVRYKQETWGGTRFVPIGQDAQYRGGRRLFTIDQLPALQAEYQQRLLNRQVEQALREKRRQEAKNKDRLEFWNAIKHVSNDVEELIDYRMENPDGTYLYLLKLPVKPGYEHKKGYDTLIVRVEPYQKVDYEASEKARETDPEAIVRHTAYRAYWTYTNGRGGSFPSCGGNEYETIGDALLNIACNRYHESG